MKHKKQLSRYREYPSPPNLTQYAAGIWHQTLISTSPFVERWDLVESTLAQRFSPRVPVIKCWDSSAFALPSMQDMKRSQLSLNDRPPSTAGAALAEGAAQLHIYAGPGTAYSVVYDDILDRAEPPLELHSPARNVDQLYALCGNTRAAREFIIKEDPFSTEFSLWFLLVDIIELPRLATILVPLIKAIKKLRFRKDIPLSVIAKSHLGVSFGLLPTIADLREFTDAVLRLAQAFGGKTAFGQVYTARQEPIELDKGKVITTDHVYRLGAATVNLSVRKEVDPLMLHRTLKYYFVCPELSSILNRLKAFADLFGLLDPTVFWDVIPFSFLIDWFFDVSSWIHNNLKPRVYPVDTVITDYCESIHQHSVVRITARYTGWSSYDVRSAVPQAYTFKQGTSHQIARKRIFPVSATFVSPPVKHGVGISFRRAIIGAALIKSGAVLPRAKPSRYRHRPGHRRVGEILRDEGPA
jgi:hypothetical protein